MRAALLAVSLSVVLCVLPAATTTAQDRAAPDGPARHAAAKPAPPPQPALLSAPRSPTPQRLVGQFLSAGDDALPDPIQPTAAPPPNLSHLLQW